MIKQIIIGLSGVPNSSTSLAFKPSDYNLYFISPKEYQSEFLLLFYFYYFKRTFCRKVKDFE